MASVTVNLTGYSDRSFDVEWNDDVAVGATFSAVGGSQTLNFLRLFNAAGTGFLAGIGPGAVRLDFTGFANHFTSAFVASGRIIVTASDGETLEVMIANADMAEPYDWTPTNSAQVIAFANHVRGLANNNATLTLTDDPATAAPAFADDTGDAQTWTQNTAIASITVPAATGTPTPTYAATGVPAGVSFNTGTRAISGSPTATGSGTITITASNSEGSDDWTVAYTTAAGVPAQPTGFAASATHDTVSLTWADPGDASITSYQILRRDITGGGSLGVHIDSVPAGTSYVDTTNVEPENTYSYRIKARNAQGLSGQSGFQNVTTLAVPSVDHAVDAVAASWVFDLPEPTVTVAYAVDAVAVAWVFDLPEPTVAVGHGVDAVAVEWTFNLPEPTVTFTPRVTTDHAVDAGAVAWVFDLPQPTGAVAHAVDAVAVAWVFDLPEPSVTHTPAAATVPAAPTGLAATATHNSVSLTWDDPNDSSITSYQILRRDISGGGSLGVHVDSVPAGTSYVDTTNVSSSNTYSYRIKARNAQGLSAQSSYRNATTSAAPSTPINHAVDAVAVAWVFDLPEPTVAVDHAVDAAAVSWVFDLPEPSVTSASAFSVELTLTQTATENVYTWTNPDSYILDFVCADDNPIGPLSGYSSVRSSIPASLLTLSYTRPAGAPYYALRLVSTDQFSNTVGPADNVASGDYAVDAAAADWVFDLPEPTVTHTPRVTDSHAVDAGAVAWVFDLPQPTGAVAHAVDAVAVAWVFALPEPSVTYTPRVTTDHAVDAVAVSWTFDLPEPTVTYTPRLMVDHAVDAVAVAWVFDLPQPRLTVTTPTVAVVTLEIDWDNDGTFSHVAADVTGDLVRHSLRTTRGRTLQSRRKATAGRLQAKLWNRTDKYSLENSSSPIFGQDLTGVRVRVKMDGVTVWAGLLDTPRYRQWPVQQVTIIALGVLSTLRQPVSVAGLASSSISTIAKAVVGAAGLGTSYVGGDKVLNQWPGVLDQVALKTLQELEETEESFLFERLDGELALDAENARSIGANALSALTLTDQIQTLTDVPLLRGSYLDLGFKQIANVINVPVATLAESGEITLVSSPDVVLPAGSTRSIIYSYPSASSPSSHRAAASWVAPVSGTDYTARTGLTLNGAVVGETYEVTFANTSAASITVDDLELRGKALVAGTTIIVPSKDSDSILKFKEREYLRPSKLFTEIGPAQEYADGRVSRHKDPVGWLVALWPAYYAPEEARSLDLSRRITVEREGETREYFLEGTGMAMQGFARMEYLLSPVPGATEPSAPVVSAVRTSWTSWDISWSKPYDGGSVILDYDARYRRVGTSAWTYIVHSGIGRTTSIADLALGMGYEVQVRAENAQGEGLWSTSLNLAVSPSLLYGARTRLHTLSTVNGESTLIAGSFGSNPASITGMAPVGEVLYGIGGDENLYTLDRDTSAATLVGDTGLSNAHDLASIGQTLYVIGRVSGSSTKLYTLDKATGAVSLVGDPGLVFYAMAAVGQSLYAVAKNPQFGHDLPKLYTLSTTDGAATMVGSTGLTVGTNFGNNYSMASPNGVLYLMVALQAIASNAISRLYTLSAITGGATQISSSNINPSNDTYIHAIAEYPGL